MCPVYKDNKYRYYSMIMIRCYYLVSMNSRYFQINIISLDEVWTSDDLSGTKVPSQCATHWAIQAWLTPKNLSHEKIPADAQDWMQWRLLFGDFLRLTFMVIFVNYFCLQNISLDCFIKICINIITYWLNL